MYTWRRLSSAARLPCSERRLSAVTHTCSSCVECLSSRFRDAYLNKWRAMSRSGMWSDVFHNINWIYIHPLPKWLCTYKIDNMFHIHVLGLHDCVNRPQFSNSRVQQYGVQSTRSYMKKSERGQISHSNAIVAACWHFRMAGCISWNGTITSLTAWAWDVKMRPRSPARVIIIFENLVYPNISGSWPACAILQKQVRRHKEIDGVKVAQ